MRCQRCDAPYADAVLDQKDPVGDFKSRRLCPDCLAQHRARVREIWRSGHPPASAVSDA